ncbi:AAA family ATPase [Candidatus Frankia nodulisporulans]|uniref:bifunctional aminoglycoside phosphotransferase/ATP-binding protein n=1 Tax=Candidatus Frankia nodulisporulans TaxID=2060052 RepID=UPI0013D77B22|nr:AAA family ATPase [Candidatus Frankia nodulisporulans]
MTAQIMPSPASVVETHTSVLVFLGDRVYKVKKAEDLGFLDFRTRQARLAACQAEVALNRRVAPDVYLGVADVSGPDGQLCDHMVVMRRLPASRRLSALVTSGTDVTGVLRDTARLVAAFHTRCDTSTEITELGGVKTLRALWEEGLAGVAPFLGDPLPARQVAEIGRLASRYLDGRGALLAERQQRGLVRDGHGDLLADDVFCLDDGPRILDCLEFDQRLRAGDVLADVAFLAMDLERLGRRDLADHFLSAYREFSGETHPRSLEDFYVAYRAFVRCKVACIRSAQGDADAAEQARTLATLALSRLRRGRTRLVLVGGLPASGKSTLAAGLGSAEGWTVLRSDVIRKELAGLSATTPAPAEPGEGLYRAEMTDAVYTELIRRADVALERGESVILDASWGSRRHRRQAARRALDAAADLIELRCAVAPEIARTRIAARMEARTAAGTTTDGLDGLDGRGRAGGAEGGDGGVSDATVPVLLELARSADPWPEATTITTTVPVARTLRTARRLLT